MAERLMGLETEYGVAPFRGGAGTPDGALRAAEALLDEARRRHLFLRDLADGLFLANASRLYIDPGPGKHIEYSTCEVTDPAEVVVRAAAGDALLAGLGEAAAGRAARHAPVLFKGNVDHTHCASWASHESYAHRANPRLLPDELIPHFVSRIVYTGAGGLNPSEPGFEFCLSPRAHFISERVSLNTTHSRPIFHLKEEHLAGPTDWKRLHVICGESLCSHRAQFLRFGTTAALLALVEAGLSPRQRLALLDPVEAMQRFSADPSLRATAPCQDGRQVSALDVQRLLLGFVEQRADHPCLPAWVPRLCAEWREALDGLEAGRQDVRARFDWGIRRQLYATHLGRRGFSWEDLPELSAWLAARAEGAGAGATGVEPTSLRDLPPLPAAEAERRRTLLELRAELCELELRFGGLGPGGLFAQLERAGVVEAHRLPEVTAERIARAVGEPPPRGRARVRGELVRQYAGHKGGYVCDWDHVRSGTGMFDLSDPFLEATPAWIERRIETRGDGAAALHSIRKLYDRGQYEVAHRELCDLESQLPELRWPEFHELQWWVAARRGFPESAERALDLWLAGGDTGTELMGLVGRIIVERFRGLGPGPALAERLLRGESCLGQIGSETSVPGLYAFRCHQGYAQLHAGQLVEAQRTLESVLASDPFRSGARIGARTLGDLAETHRRLGDREAARDCLAQAATIQRGAGFLGDWAEFTLACRAKLEEPDAAREALREAERVQLRQEHHFALARTLLLTVRVLPAERSRDTVQRRLEILRAAIPALGRCPLLAKITSRWDEWCGGGQPAEEADRFWGL